MSGDTRTRILSTARDLFVARTYKASSMREIAEHVGITKPSLYHHFRSKTEILDSLVGPPIDELTAVVSRGGTPIDVLSGCIGVMLKHRKTMTLLLRDSSIYGDETIAIMGRLMTTVEQATSLVAGPDPSWRQRVRAAQAFAAATDPISMFLDVPEAELHAELLRGATAVLG